MNKMQVFNNSVFGQVRTIEEEGKVLFCAKDIAIALGYSNVRDAVGRHCKGVVKRDGVSYTTNQHGKESAQVTKMNFIPEGDVYRLIVRSKLPSAEKFERWVFDEVLPSIHATGGYNPQLERAVGEVANAVAGVANVLQRLEKRISHLENEGQGDSITLEEEPPRRRRRYPSIISRLEPELLQEVEAMICSGRHTFSEVARFLADYGVRVSVTSVWRYAKSIELLS